jgi:Uncharacterized conserved protein
MIETADTFLARFRGLMGRRELAPGHALLLEGCSSVHMFFMKFALDIVYLDRDFRVLYVETLRPWQIGSLVKGCAHVLELNAGEVCPSWRPGELLSVGDVAFEER